MGLRRNLAAAVASAFAALAPIAHATSPASTDSPPEAAPQYTKGPCGSLIPVIKPTNGAAASSTSGSTSSGSDTTAQDSTATKDQLGKIMIGPLSLAVGPQERGGFGASLKGGDSPYSYRLNSDDCSSKGPFGFSYEENLFLGYAVDGSLSSQSDAHNSLSVDVTPKLAILIETPETPIKAALDFVGIEPFLDLRYRTGDFQNASKAYVRTNQIVYGGGLVVAWTGAMPEWPSLFITVPSLSAGYYGVDGVGGSAGALPADIEQNYASASVTAKIRLPWPAKQLESSPLSFDTEFDESIKNGTDKPKPYTNLAVVYQTSGGLKPAVTYRSGQQGGFSYDRQLLIGLLWQLR